MKKVKMRKKRNLKCRRQSMFASAVTFANIDIHRLAKYSSDRAEEEHEKKTANDLTSTVCDHDDEMVTPIAPLCDHHGGRH